MSVEELIEKDTSSMSLSQMIDAVDGAMNNEKILYLIRHKHEEDTGIPMEDDDIGKAFSEKVHKVFSGISMKIKE